MPQIMIVEDKRYVYLPFANWLSEVGYDVMPFLPSGEKALEALEACEANNTLPDIAVLDIELEGEMNGIKLARKIQARWPIPFIFLTDKEDLRDHALRTATFAFLDKPVDAEELEAEIRKLLAAVQHIKQQAAARNNAAPSDAFMLKKVDKLLRIRLQDLYYIESLGDRSIRLFTATGVHATALNLTELLEKLDEETPGHEVLRIHRQFAVNLFQVEAIQGRTRNYKVKLLEVKEPLPVGRTYEDELKVHFGLS